MFFFITLFFFYIHSKYARANIKLYESSSTSSPSSSSEEDRQSVEPFLQGEEPQGGLPIPERGHWIWWERKKIGARPSSFPPSAIPTSIATAMPGVPTKQATYQVVLPIIYLHCFKAKFRVRVGMDIKKSLKPHEDAGSTIWLVAFFAIDLCYLSFLMGDSTIRAGSTNRQNTGTVRNAGENFLLKESSPGAKHTQWKPLTMQGPLESRLGMLHSRSDHAQTVCIPLVWCSVGREEHTICNMICFRPYVLLSLSWLRHTGAFYVAGLVTWQTVNMTHRT